MKLVYGVNDKPKFGQLIIFAFQQLLSIMTATLVVPVIINGTCGTTMSSAAALFGAGIGTLIYLAFTKRKSPVFLGSSFAFINSMIAAFAGGVSMSLGFLGLIIGAFFAGLVYVIIAIIVKFAGVNWLNKIMPAVVIGPTVAIIGLSLAGNAVGDLAKGGVTKAVIEPVIQKSEEGIATLAEVTNFVPVANPLIAVLCGIITLLIVILCSTYGNKTMKLIPFIIGILGGYAVCAIFTVIGHVAQLDALKLLNIEPFKALVANGISLNTFFTVPEFTFLGAFDGIKEITPAYISTIAVAYIPVAFVVFAEHIADHKNISSIIEADLLNDPGLHRTLLGDGVGSMFGAFFGGCPNTTYGESVGCVAITRNASVRTIMLAAILSILIAFVAPFIAFVNSIPPCVMGGVCMALYGFIAVSGLKMIQKVDLNQNKNLFVVSAILIAGIGGLELRFGQILITPIACALILGIIINLVLSKSKEE
ncbi:MAG: uracil-xanthine permease [Ruminococcaceae bacterium]|nr:uracil-xanthine permease [Oscillospiraceae bacterium]